MKLGRILAALLALTLCIGLSCPALADYEDTDPPMWQQWGYDSLEDYLANWNETEEEYYQEAAWYVAEERDWPVWREAYLAAHPDYIADLVAEDAKDPFWQNWGYESPEQFEEEMCGDDMSYTDWLVNWYLEDLFWDEWYAEQRLREREAMGGPAEGIGVMWMGSYVQFPDAQPTVRNERTMIPVRAFMEFTGAEVDYADNTVYLTLPDGTKISFVIGEMTAQLTRGGVSSSFSMDTPTYAENNRTYVPLRFFSEALGYDVLWDADYQTAVVIDPVSTIKEIDESFTIMNRVLAAQQRDSEKAYSVRGSMTGDITLFDTLKGNKTCSLAMDISGLTQGMNMDLKSNWDMKEFISMLLPSMGTLAIEMDETTTALLDAMESTELELIYNGDTDQMYLRSPAFSAVFALIVGGDAGTTTDMWYGFCPGLNELLAAPADAVAPTVGALIYALTVDEYAGINAYSDAMQTASDLITWIGDYSFIKNNGGWTLRFSVDDLLDRLGIDYDDISGDLLGLYGDYGELGVETFDVQLYVDAEGNCSGSADVLIDNVALGMKLAAKLVLTDEQMSYDVFLHLRNSAELHLVTDMTVAESTKVPRQAPPASDPVFDLDAGELPVGDVMAEAVAGTAGLGLL